MTPYSDNVRECIEALAERMGVSPKTAKVYLSPSQREPRARFARALAAHWLRDNKDYTIKKVAEELRIQLATADKLLSTKPTMPEYAAQQRMKFSEEDATKILADFAQENSVEVDDIKEDRALLRKAAIRLMDGLKVNPFTVTFILSISHSEATQAQAEGMKDTGEVINLDPQRYKQLVQKARDGDTRANQTLMLAASSAPGFMASGHSTASPVAAVVQPHENELKKARGKAA